VAIIKHANPCGVAVGDTFIDAYKAALACDPVSAFGGIVALNGRLDKQTATAILKVFTEVVIAPSADDDAIALFAKKKNLRLLIVGDLPDPLAPSMTQRNVAGGILVQDRDNGYVADEDLTVVTKRKPTDAEMADMRMAWKDAPAPQTPSSPSQTECSPPLLLAQRLSFNPAEVFAMMK